ncbi:MAG: hypothetical protein EHM47_06610 [Ignavibacteriales bacterium]|nr:MAG: hypothetical protein EHM47_06610 [Ignavibacteriales bacterium]
MIKILVILVIFGIPALGFSPGDTVKAKIAILHKAGEVYNPLRTKDRLKAGEMLRIFVLPEKDCFVYAVHSGDKESFLLCKTFLKEGNDSLFLPTPEDYYIFDEGGVKEKITIFCSSKKISEIENLFKNSEIISSGLWDEAEEKLIASTKTNLNETSDKPFSLAGNVSAVNEDFMDSMQLFVGDELLIRKYEIEVKK